MVSTLLAIAIIALASVVVGGGIANFVGGSQQQVVQDNPNVSYATNGSLTATVNPINKFDFIKWLFSIPLIAMLMNVLQEIQLVSSWLVLPFSAFVCFIVRFFNSSALCSAYAGLLIMLPIVAGSILGLVDRAHTWAIRGVIVLIAIFIIGVILMMFGVLH